MPPSFGAGLVLAGESYAVCACVIPNGDGGEAVFTNGSNAIINLIAVYAI